MPIDPVVSNVPELVHMAVEGLWQLPMRSEERIYSSGAFRMLEDACRSVYLGLEKSRLVQAPSLSITSSVLNRALQNFFRWNGAPWLAGHAPSAGETALTLHRAFLSQSVNRTYLVPLDRFALEDCSSGNPNDINSVRFGPNEIVRLQREELVRRVPVEALARFGTRQQFPTADLDGFRWLVTSSSEPAGPIERRTWLNFFNTSLAAVGTVELFRPVYPPPVENALFVLLLTFRKDPRKAPWQPFRVPWVFSFTDDLFSSPVAPPDASKLTRGIVGDDHDYFEVPDESETFEFGGRQREALLRRWKEFGELLLRAGTGDANLHLLTRHFFVKALPEYGIDEIISNLSCLEATLRLETERGRKPLMQRYERLVANDKAFQWLDAAYRLRNTYLHSLGGLRGKLTWADLARTRWAVATAVGKYVDLATRHPQSNREQLLKRLDP